MPAWSGEEYRHAENNEAKKQHTQKKLFIIIVGSHCIITAKNHLAEQTAYVG